MVYLWNMPENYPKELIGRYDRERGPDRFLFKAGRRLGTEAGHPAICFSARQSKLLKFDSLANNAMVPLINDRVARILLEICPDDVELVDTLVVAKDQTFSGYRIVNATNRARGIDLAGSEYTMMVNANAILGFKKLRYLEGCLGTHDLAREDEYSSFLLVSERLRNAIVAERTSGIELRLPSEMKF
jgi:hypothetical protein